MAEPGAEFEVEIRCRFESPEEVYLALPFVHSCLEREASWVTNIYGLALFKSGFLLRTAEVIEQNQTRYYLGWKGPDIGEFANARLEIGEECTNGIVKSAIVKKLGGNEGRLTRDAAIREFERLGHAEFMSFQGIDLSGYDGALGVSVKLMSCRTLRWPLLVELEKTARTEEEARRCEEELRQLSVRFHLRDRLVREEPPTLLYARLFGAESTAA